MSNIKQEAKLGTPAVTQTLPKDIKVSVQQQDAEGRWLAMVQVGKQEPFALPGSHPTKLDAQNTADGYLEQCRTPVVHGKTRLSRG
jgi:hypothetical protein